MKLNFTKSAATAALIGASLLLASCGTTTNQSGDNEQSGASTSSIETMFGPVTLPEGDPEDWTVVALGWSDAEVALGLGIKPVAVFDWMSLGEENKGVGDWATPLFGDVVPTVFPNVDQALDYEAIQALKPDLILNVRSDNDEGKWQRLSAIAPTIAGPEGAEAYAVDWRTHTSVIAQSLKKSDEGAAMVAEVDALIDSYRSQNPQFAGKTAVSGSKFGDAYGVSLPGDTRWDLLDQLGFELNPGVLDLPSSGFFAPVTLEQANVLNADVAVLFPIGYSLDELKSDPILSALPVVTEGRAVMLDPNDEITVAFSAMSVLSVPIAASGLVPLLEEATTK